MSTRKALHAGSWYSGSSELLLFYFLKERCGMGMVCRVEWRHLLFMQDQYWNQSWRDGWARPPYHMRQQEPSLHRILPYHLNPHRRCPACV